MKKYFYFLCFSFILSYFEIGFAQTTHQVSNGTELQSALNVAVSGDTIILESGNYGELSIYNRNNSVLITITANSGSEPIFTKVSVNDSSNWTIRGLHIQPRFTNGADGYNAVVLNGSHLTFEDSNINYADDISSWLEPDWLAKAGNGISMRGDNLTIRKNTILNVDHGIHGDATDSIVSRNKIINFRGDGIRGLGDRMLYEYNLVKNSYDVDGNHDDGFQSWSYGAGGIGTGIVSDVVLRGNIFINHEDLDQNLKGPMQGIGLFDGTYVNWTIENNLVVTNHWHGITMMGAINSRIINNTVLDSDTERPGPPWIRIAAHKNGTPPNNCVVRNNLATDFSSVTGVVSDHNLVLGMNELTTYFANPPEGDYHLNSTSPAIDLGSSEDAPDIDIEGNVRPQGDSWDIGAFELGVGQLTPPTNLKILQ